MFIFTLKSEVLNSIVFKPCYRDSMINVAISITVHKIFIVYQENIAITLRLSNWKTFLFRKIFCESVQFMFDVGFSRG